MSEMICEIKPEDMNIEDLADLVHRLYPDFKVEFYHGVLGENKFKIKKERGNK